MSTYNIQVADGWSKYKPKLIDEKKLYIADSCCCDVLKEIIRNLYDNGDLYFCYGECFSFRGVNELEFFAYTNSLDFNDLWDKKENYCIVLSKDSVKDIIRHGIKCRDFIYHKLLVD